MLKVPYKVAGTRETEIRSFKNPYPFRPLFPYYCEQDTTGLFDINYDIIPEETLTNYCEQDITGFYDFAQAP